jgi:hypothetical protein
MRGRTTTFYFSEVLGITTFYSVSDAASLGLDSDELNDLIPLFTFVLAADKGFLRKPLALSKATQTAECGG